MTNAQETRGSGGLLSVFRAAVWAAGFGLVVGCSESPAPAGSDARDANPSEAESASVTGLALASVGDTVITEADLEMLLERVVGENSLIHSAQLLADEANRKKMLESLVSSRAMAKAEEQSLSPDELKELDRQVRFYREELLVKRFLDKHADVQPVSTDMVKDFYQSNQAGFQEEAQYRFEVLTTYGELHDAARKKILTAFEKAESEPDWKQFEQRLTGQNLPVRVQQAQARLSLLTPQLQTLVQHTDVGDVSGVAVDTNIQVVRVLERTPGAVKPLAEVSSEIRKRLAPIMMKKAIDEASQHARSQFNVTYTTDD